MAKQTINIGAAPNDGTGTPLRTSFDYTNQNFTELYTALGGGVGLPGATTQVIFNDGGTNLAGDAGLTYNKTTDALTLAGPMTMASSNVTGGTIPANGTWLPAANTLEFAANSLAQYRIAPLGVFNWYDGAGGTRMTLNSTGLGIGGSVTNKLTVNNTAATGAVSFLSTGTTTAYNLGQFSNTGGSLYFGVDNSAGSAISGATAYGSVIGSSNNTKLHLIINNTVKATVDLSGSLLVAKTSSSQITVGCELLSSGIINGTTANLDNLNIYNTTAGAYRFYVTAAGTVYATNATISAISDARLKENVQDIDVGLAAILSLKPRKFDWKAGKGKDIKGDRGFIAQEFETVFPNLVDEWKDHAPEGEATYKSVRQDLIPVLVKAIQELTARVQTLEAR